MKIESLLLISFLILVQTFVLFNQIETKSTLKSRIKMRKNLKLNDNTLSGYPEHCDKFQMISNLSLDEMFDMKIECYLDFCKSLYKPSISKRIPNDFCDKLKARLDDEKKEKDLDKYMKKYHNYDDNYGYPEHCDDLYSSNDFTHYDEMLDKLDTCQIKYCSDNPNVGFCIKYFEGKEEEKDKLRDQINNKISIIEDLDNANLSKLPDCNLTDKECMSKFCSKNKEHAICNMFVDPNKKPNLKKPNKDNKDKNKESQ